MDSTHVHINDLLQPNSTLTRHQWGVKCWSMTTFPFLWYVQLKSLKLAKMASKWLEKRTDL